MSVNFLNAGLGSQTQMPGADLTAEFKTYYQRVLLDTARPLLIHQQYGQQFTIPKNSGKTTEWRRAWVLPVKTTPLTEGVAPNPDYFGYDAITVTIAQYGAWIKGTDIVKTVTFDPLLDNISEEQGDQAGRTLETLTVTALSAATNIVYGGVATSFATLVTTDVITYKNLVRLRRVLEVNLAKPWKGRWYALAMHPMVESDLYMDTTLKDLYLRTDDGKVMYDGEIGRLLGFTIGVSTMALVIPKNTTVAGQTNANTDVYQSLAFGRGAFGIVELESMGLETIFNPVGSARAADPLSQFWTSGWKCTFAVRILNDAYMARFMSAGGTSN